MQRMLYVWELPVRLTHWINVLCIAAMTITGLYIGNPFIHAGPSGGYIMGWMRLVHFIASYLFAVSVLVRTYWSLVGNSYAHIGEFLHFTPQKLVDLIGDTRYYIFMKKDQQHSRGGHSVLASVVYLGLWILFFIEIFTGFALYSQSHYGGGLLWKILGGWLLSFFSVQTIRLCHHLIMWMIIFFVIEHIYISWITREERGGFITSILNGYKTVEE